MMNKLGFEIVRTKNGLTPTLICNEGSWNYNIIDVGGYLKLFSDIDTTDRFITFLSFDANGCFLTLLRGIPGRAGDNLSGWIYIPNTIEITGEEINTAYNFVHNVLLMSDITDYKEKIDSFFSKPYPAKSTPISYTPSSKEDKYGFIRENVSPSFCSLEDFFKYRYQPEYSQYKAVFFLNSKDSIVEEYNKLFNDLTNHELKELCVLNDFSEADKKRLHIDKIVDIKNREVRFPQVYAKNERVKLYAIRRGFEPKELDIRIDEGNKCLSTDRISWVKKITSDIFVIKGKDGKPINGLVTIRVNKKDITNRPEYFYECDLENATVVVNAKGYEDYSERHKLLSETKPILIQMHRKEKSFDCKIELVKGGSANMSLKSKDLAGYRTDESPLEGYINDRGTLKISSSYKWKQRGWGMLIGACIVILLCCIPVLDSCENYKFKWGLPPWEEITTDEPDADTTTIVDSNQPQPATLKYLNDNDKWRRDSLSKDVAIDGLFDMINQYRFVELAEFSKVDGCEELKKIADLASQMNEKGQTMTGSYCNDSIITISKWIDKVQKKLDESKSDNKKVEGENAENAQNKSADKKTEEKKEQADTEGKLGNQVKSKKAKKDQKTKEKGKTSDKQKKNAKNEAPSEKAAGQGKFNPNK